MRTTVEDSRKHTQILLPYRRKDSNGEENGK